jgi:AraC-like DNA-binding protein/quercetin dioxygenase-like cupin family protein
MKPSLIDRAHAIYPPGPEFYAGPAPYFQVAGVHCLLYKNYEIAKHTHGFTELNLVIGGSGEHFIEDQAFAVDFGDVFVIPKQVQHAYRQQKNLDVYHLLLSDRFLEQHSAKLRLLPGFVLFFTVEPYFRAETDFRFGLKLPPDRTAQIAEMLRQIMLELKTPDNGSALAIESLALYAITLLCRDYANQFSAATKKVGPLARSAAIQKTMAHIDEHYAEKVTLGELARLAHMAPNHFGRVFRDATRMTPMDYVQNARLRAAQNLLLSCDRSVTEVGLECGFYDAAHFSRSFSRAFGCSPNRFRKQAAERS